jgi:hypothetical protein
MHVAIFFQSTVNCYRPHFFLFLSPSQPKWATSGINTFQTKFMNSCAPLPSKELSQAKPLMVPDKSGIKMKISKEHWCNYTEREKLWWVKNLSQWQCVHYKCHMTDPEVHLNNIKKYLFSSSQRTQSIKHCEDSRLMLLREIIADCYGSHKEYTYRMCGKNAEVFVCFSRGDTWLTWGFERLNT